jgi:gag-polypeptide of LTR copia-type/Domain of unknown function (DUF4219)
MMGVTETDKVRFELLDETNYAHWARRMRSLLTIKRLWSFVELGAGAVPADATVAQKAEAAIKDQTALHTMATFLSDQYLSLVDDCETSKALWDLLERTFKAKSTARRQQLRRELYGLRKTPDESISTYVNRAREIAKDLKGIGYPADDDSVVGAILSGLPSTYSSTRDHLEDSRGELTMDVVYEKLLQAEQRHVEEGAYVLDGQRAMMVRAGRGNGRGGDIQCWYCGKRGHKQAECHKKKKDENPKSFAAFDM